MSLEIIIGNHQEAIEIPVSWVTALEDVGERAAEMAGEFGLGEEYVLRELTTVEVAMVDDETSARVHEDFMGIEGSTDVITFHHGEIVIGVEVAKRQAEEYGEPFGREILRYFIHGLLHLAGHEDGTDEDREVMEAAQEEIVGRLWADGLGEKLGDLV
jgi:probable rRNA maturation factor